MVISVEVRKKRVQHFWVVFAPLTKCSAAMVFAENEQEEVSSGMCQSGNRQKSTDGGCSKIETSTDGLVTVN